MKHLGVSEVTGDPERKMVQQVKLELIGWRQSGKDSNVNSESKAYHLSSSEPLKEFQHRE